jgi:hypothetical protein
VRLALAFAESGFPVFPVDLSNDLNVTGRLSSGGLLFWRVNEQPSH